MQGSSVSRMGKLFGMASGGQQKLSFIVWNSFEGRRLYSLSQITGNSLSNSKG